MRYLKSEIGQDQAKIDDWYHHWVIAGFEALEAMLGPGPYAYGADVTLADICLVPQVYNARRLKVPLDTFPRSSPSMRPAPSCRPSKRRGRKTSPTRSETAFVRARRSVDEPLPATP